MDLPIVEKEGTFERDGVAFRCALKYYKTPDGSLCESGDLIDQNLLVRQDAYRKAAGLLTSAGIKRIRNGYRLSQKDFSLALGLGEISVTRFETKLAQSKTIDEVMRRAEEDPYWFLEKFESYSSLMEREKAQEARTAILDAIDSKDYLKTQLEELIKSRYVRYQDPSSFNGYKKLNIQAIIGIASMAEKKQIPLPETKLAKLLFYSDFYSFQKTGHGITGLVYRHLPYGACPLAFDSLLQLPFFKIDEKLFPQADGDAWFVDFVSSVRSGHLDEDEKALVGEVLAFFQGMNTQQIVERMHQEKAYQETKPNDIIDYSYSKTLSLTK
jgi:DNA-binding transcriptional regulator YiaG